MRVVCPHCNNIFEVTYRGRKAVRLVIKRGNWELSRSDGKVTCPYCGFEVKV